MKSTDHIAVCKYCGGYIDYDTDGYNSSDSTYSGECLQCGKIHRGNFNEVDDYHWLRGDYKIGGEKYLDFD